MPTPAAGRSRVPRLRSAPDCRLLALGLAVIVPAAPVAWAQEAGSVRPLTLTASVAVGQHWTDNRDLSSTDQRAEALTTLTPSMRAAVRSETVRALLDYSLNMMSSDHGESEAQHRLAAQLTAEPVRRTVFVDARANISQQSISAFGVQSSSGPRLSNGNQTEVRTGAVSPYLRGRVAGAVDLEARLAISRTDTEGSGSGDTASRISSLTAAGDKGRLRWSTSFDNTRIRYDGGRATSVERYSGALTFHPHYDWTLQARLGREREDVFTLRPERRTSWGLGATWRPSPRTDADAQVDERYYGRAYRLAFVHRTARLVWRFTAVRDASSDRAAAGAGAAREYERLDAFYALQVPDPVARDRLIRSLLDERASGQANAVTLNERMDASVMWSGLRVSASLSVNRGSTRRLDGVSTVQDDFSRVGQIDQSGANLLLSYRLTPTGQAGLGWTRQSHSAGSARTGNTLNTTSLSWSEQLWQQAAVSASLRRTTFHADLNPYTENGASITFSLRF